MADNPCLGRSSVNVDSNLANQPARSASALPLPLPLSYYLSLPVDTLQLIINEAYRKGYLSPSEKLAITAFDTNSGYAQQLKDYMEGVSVLEPGFTVTWTGRTYVHYLATLRDTRRLRAFLATGVDVNARDRNRDTALTLVAGEGVRSMVYVLLDAGADINAQDAGGMSALMCAVVNNHLPTVTVLVDRGANIDLRDSTGATALLLAAALGRRDIVQVLLEVFPDVDAADNRRMTALLWAVSIPDVAMAAMLLQAEADVNAPVGGFTPLMMAALRGHSGAVALLLQAKADVSTAHDGVTAATLAERHGHAEVAQILRAATVGQLPIPVAPSAAVSGVMWPGAALWHTPAAMATAVGVPQPALTDAAQCAAVAHTSGASSSMDSNNMQEKTATASDRVGDEDTTHHNSADDVDSHKGKRDGDETMDDDVEAEISIEKNAEEDATSTSEPAAEGAPQVEVTLADFVTACVVTGDVTVVHLGLAAGMSPNRVELGTSLLHKACTAGHAAVVKVLAAAKADVRALDADGLSPLQVASEKGKDEVFNVLLLYVIQNDGQPQLAENSGRGGMTVQHLVDACRNGDTALVKAALQAGLPINMCLAEGKTLLAHACEANQTVVAQKLLEAKAIVHLRDPDGYTPLMVMVQRGNAAMVALLLDAKASIHTEDTRGDNTLKVAVSCGAENMLGVLLRAPTPSGSQCSALIEQVKLGNLKNVTHLIAAGARVDGTDAKGRSAMLIAALQSNRSMVEILEGKAPPISMSADLALLMQRLPEYTNVTDLLLNLRLNGDKKGEDGLTLMQWASLRGTTGVIELLLEAGVGVSLKDDNGRTALHNAAWKGCSASVRALVDAKADVADVEKDGLTPLHSASWNGCIDAVRALLAAKAPVDAVANAGWTALFPACQNGHAEVVKLLLEAGVCADVLDSSGRSASEYASWNGYHDIANMLHVTGSQ